MSRSISRRAFAAAVGALVALAPLGAAQAAPDARGPSSDRRSQHSPAPLLTPTDGDVIEGRYIVVFDKATPGRSVDRARSDAQRGGARVVRSYGAALQGFAAELPAQALKGLRNNPNVAFVEQDVEVTATDTQSPATWGIDRIDQRNRPLDNSYTYGASGQGVTTYVIDTGIRTGHAEFSGRARGGFTAINDGRGAEDCNGHGTHVAGTVGGETYGVAQDVALVAVRVLGCNGSGSNSGVIAGVDWVTANHSGPSVANMSLGGVSSTALDTAVRSSIASGVTYSLAAGNDNANACNGSPNRVGEGLTVGSTTSGDQRSSFSNYGSCVDLFAPGSSITSAWYTSNTATNTISGTSMAAPHVAGTAALYLEDNPSASPSQVNAAITGSATPNVLSGIGSGSPNLLLYSLLDDAPGPDPDPDPACSLPETETGSLSGTGDIAYHPGSSGYYYSGSGTQVGCLEGPSGTDFDLYLEKWSGSSWVRVAQSISSSSSEQVTYSGTSGYYSWVVDSYSGSGAYTFGLDRP
ncbi:MAG TPA: S8 family peptidase [Actinomycetales bacterium]|nr:S8 family peptidase [Actinomycetales bacterium]